MPTNALGIFTPLRERRLGPLVLDAVLEEAVSHNVVVTDHPIEVVSADGVARGEIADHAYQEPDTYTMRGVVSDFPITWRARIDAYAESGDETRSVSAYQILKRHQADREPFDVIWGLGVLRNMLILSLKTQRTAASSRVFDFTAEVRQVQIVVPRELKRERSLDDVDGDAQAEARAVPEVDAGEVAPRSPEVSHLRRFATGLP